MPEDPKPLTSRQAAGMLATGDRVRLAASHVMSVRLSSNELRLLANESARVGMTVGAFIKRAALDAAESRRFSGPTIDFGVMVAGIAVNGAQIVTVDVGAAEPGTTFVETSALEPATAA
jgi:hypothetical protein